MQAVTKQQLAYNFLWEKIHSGEFLPGQRIVAGRVAHEIGTSGIPVREALLQLEAEGLVEITPHVGAIVAFASASELLCTMRTVAVLEGYATRLALAHGREIVSRLRDVNDAMISAASGANWAALSDRNSEFHDIIHRASGNDVLVDTIRALLRRYGSLRRRTVFLQLPDRALQSGAEHGRIIEMLADTSTGEQELEDVARRHKMTTADLLESHLREASVAGQSQVSAGDFEMGSA